MGAMADDATAAPAWHETCNHVDSPMHTPIEDYALLGDCHGAGLLSREGSLDWLCLPRFDSGACFAALLGEAKHGRWLLRPVGRIKSTRRCYREGTLTLETDVETETGSARMVDAMPIETESVDVVRLVEGLSGTVDFEMELVPRFDYGSIVPWATQKPSGLVLVAGPDKLTLRTPIELDTENGTSRARFQVGPGQRVPFVLTYQRSHSEDSPPIDPVAAVDATDTWWRRWSARSKYSGRYRESVARSLITLKALTYMPTGGLVAAPTTSLPEALGGSRNWDYRYCWLRDATVTLSAMLGAGYEEEARAWREWLLRAVAGEPSTAQIMYGIEGRRRLEEYEIPWLPGYQNSKPVRIGNAAHRQLQHDIYGELMNTMHHCRVHGFENKSSWRLETALVEHLEGQWHLPDEGIWEFRGDRQHFVHSKMMSWVAFDRAARAVRQFGRPGPAERWEHLRDTIHGEICRRGFHVGLNSFTQAYDSDALDASLLMMAPAGFLPADDARIRGTVRAIRARLSEGDLLRRYETDGSDGLPAGEGCFLPCSFWLVDNLALAGEASEARRLFEALLDLRNDVGLLAEEYDPSAGRQIGNFPQALTHLALINSAYQVEAAADT